MKVPTHLRALKSVAVATAVAAALGMLACDSKSEQTPGTVAAKDATPEAAPASDKAKTAKVGDAAVKGKSYGAPLEGADAVTIAAVMDAPEKYDGKVVRVQGMVTDVCTMRGCWFEMAGDRPGMKMRFKVQDGKMVFPASAKGKQAIAEGTVSVSKMSLEQTRKWEAHMASDAGKEFDPETVTEPTVMVMLKGHGAVISDS